MTTAIDMIKLKKKKKYIFFNWIVHNNFISIVVLNRNYKRKLILTQIRQFIILVNFISIY